MLRTSFAICPKPTSKFGQLKQFCQKLYIQLLEYAIPLSVCPRDKKSGPPLFSNSPIVWDDQRLEKLTDTSLVQSLF